MFGFIKKSRKVVTGSEMEIALSSQRIDMKKEYIKESLSKRHLPIVLLDPLWYSIREQIKSDLISKNEAKLQELLKEQGRLNTDYKEYTAVKQNFLKQIIVVGDEVQKGGDSHKMEELNKLHQSTLATNEKLEAIEGRISEVEEEIEAVNRKIIEEMIAVAYEYIEACKLKEMTLEQEIEALRSEMLLKTNEKKEAEKLEKGIYSYMHNIVGQQQVEIIDKAIGISKK